MEKKQKHDPAKIAVLLDAAIEEGKDLTPVIADIKATMESQPKAPTKVRGK